MTKTRNAKQFAVVRGAKQIDQVAEQVLEEAKYRLMRMPGVEQRIGETDSEYSERFVEALFRFAHEACVRRGMSRHADIPLEEFQSAAETVTVLLRVRSGGPSAVAEFAEHVRKRLAKERAAGVEVVDDNGAPMTDDEAMVTWAVNHALGI